MNYPLHFVGKSMYNINIFEREAKLQGVQRAISFNFLKKLEFGKPILLARYISPQKDIDKKIVEPSSAEVFGYMTLNSISHNLPKKYQNKLAGLLDIVKVNDGKGEKIQRACGSYVLGETVIIKNSLEELIQKIKLALTTFEHNEDLIVQNSLDGHPHCLCDKCSCDPHDLQQCLEEQCDCCVIRKHISVNKFKWFISGNYKPIKPFIIKNIKFSRGLKSVEISDLNLQEQDTDNAKLIFIYDYKQRAYMSRRLKNRLDMASKNYDIRDF